MKCAKCGIMVDGDIDKAGSTNNSVHGSSTAATTLEWILCDQCGKWTTESYYRWSRYLRSTGYHPLKVVKKSRDGMKLTLGTCANAWEWKSLWVTHKLLVSIDRMKVLIPSMMYSKEVFIMVRRLRLLQNAVLRGNVLDEESYAKAVSHVWVSCIESLDAQFGRQPTPAYRCALALRKEFADLYVRTLPNNFRERVSKRGHQWFKAATGSIPRNTDEIEHFGSPSSESVASPFDGILATGEAKTDTATTSNVKTTRDLLRRDEGHFPDSASSKGEDTTTVNLRQNAPLPTNRLPHIMSCVSTFMDPFGDYFYIFLQMKGDKDISDSDISGLRSNRDMPQSDVRTMVDRTEGNFSLQAFHLCGSRVIRKLWKSTMTATFVGNRPRVASKDVVDRIRKAVSNGRDASILALTSPFVPMSYDRAMLHMKLRIEQNDLDEAFLTTIRVKKREYHFAMVTPESLDTHVEIEELIALVGEDDRVSRPFLLNSLPARTMWVGLVWRKK